MMGESEPTLDELIDLIRRFAQERDWEQFNKPAALAVSASIEMGELLELFQWKTDEDVENGLQDADFKEALAGEIADVFVYLLRICDKAGIDPVDGIVKKMKKNVGKYPVENWKGRAPSKFNRSE